MMTRGLVIVASLLAVTHALYFHIAETERKCFIEEIPDETMVRIVFLSNYFSVCFRFSKFKKGVICVSGFCQEEYAKS